jgi:hypothetical protein
MKTQMDRSYPIILDVVDQKEIHPNMEYVFLYDDGHAFRAFLCDGVLVNEYVVEAFETIKGDLWHENTTKTLVKIPSDTIWRLVHVSNIEFISGRDMEKVERENYKNKRLVQKEFKLEVDEMDKDDDKEKLDLSKLGGPDYALGYNPKQYA